MEFAAPWRPIVPPWAAPSCIYCFLPTIRTTLIIGAVFLNVLFQDPLDHLCHGRRPPEMCVHGDPSEYVNHGSRHLEFTASCRPFVLHSSLLLSHRCCHLEFAFPRSPIGSHLSWSPWSWILCSVMTLRTTLTMDVAIGIYCFLVQRDLQQINQGLPRSLQISSATNSLILSSRGFQHCIEPGLLRQLTTLQNIVARFLLY